MKVKSKIELEFKTPKDAKIIFKTLEVDNENFLNSKIENTTITYEIDNESLTTTLATIDKLLPLMNNFFYINRAKTNII